MADPSIGYPGKTSISEEKQETRFSQVQALLTRCNPTPARDVYCDWGVQSAKVLSRDCMLSIDQLGPGLHELPGPLGLHDPSQLCRWRGVLHGSGFVVLNGMASRSHSFDFWLRWPVHEA